MKFETKAIHAGQEADAATGSVTVPVYQTATYKQDGIGRDRGWEYSRTGNPTRAAWESAIAALEGGKFGLAFASGLAAETAVLSLLKSGDHIVAGDELYGGTYRLFEQVFSRWGITASYVDTANAASVARAVRKNTKMLWLETPSNPLLKIADINALAALARRKNIVFVADNTFASPYFQNPLELGADIVLHSATKYLGGHSDVVGGVVVTSNGLLYDNIKFHQNAQGAVPGPWDCWLMLRGIKTLPVRMREHEANAKYLAAFLSGHPAVEKVYYPGLQNHPGHTVAKRQMRGFGGLVSIKVKGGFEAAKTVAENLTIFTLGESLGGVESLVCHPAKMTHASIPEKERKRLGITDNLLRLSVGLENRDDLKADLVRTLGMI
jgi:cystathionine gamma-synthase/cystathionine gamma-lyase